MRPYFVRDGDYLTQLGHRHGFDPEAVWSHPKNEGVRSLRGDPEVLAPGDLVYLPDAPRPRFDLMPGGDHRFRARRLLVEVRVVLNTDSGALANEPYEVEGAGRPIKGQTDGSGLLRAEVPVDVRLLRVHLKKRGQTIDLMVGHLDPVSERSGQRQRLEHLGYLEHRAGPTYADSAVAEMHERTAIAAFQRAQELKVTGEADEATQKKLAEVHGS